jgi:hypothetical protein
LLFKEKCLEAEPLLLESLEIRKSKFGQEHVDVADSMSSLGQLYRKQVSDLQPENPSRIDRSA